jgi:hypothetical protein
MKRRGFFAAVAAALASPLALAERVAKLKPAWLTTPLHMTEAEFVRAMIPGMEDLEHCELALLCDRPDVGARRSNVMAENFRRAYGGRRCGKSWLPRART